MRRKLALIVVCMFIALMTTPVFSACASSKIIRRYNELLAHHDYYKSITEYFKYARKEAYSYSFGYKDLLLMLGADLPLSFLCLWLSLHLLSGRRGSEAKSYMWFLLALSISRFVSFILFYVVWAIVDSLVLSLRPAWRQPFVTHLYIWSIASFSVIYIWLVARTFKFGALDSFKIFLISHILYCGIVALFIFAVPNRNIAEFVDKNMGLKPIIQSYLMDIDKISKGRSTVSLIRIKTYHI